MLAADARFCATYGRIRRSYASKADDEVEPARRAQVVAGLTEGRRGMAALITGRPEAELDDETVRSAGSVQMALMSGVMVQWLVDPASAPTAEQIAAGLRAVVS